MASCAGSERKGQILVDPVLAISLAWAEAHSATADHCLKQQKLETQLLKRSVRPKEVEGKSAGWVGHGNSIRQAYAKAQAAELLAAEQEQELLKDLAQTPASSLAGIAAKLAVIVREAEDNTDLSDFPVVHVRSALDDLERLMEQAALDQLPVLAPGMTPDGRLVPASPSVAAWCAFQAWSQADEARYRIWMTAFRALTDL